MKSSFTPIMILLGLSVPLPTEEAGGQEAFDPHGTWRRCHGDVGALPTSDPQGRAGVQRLAIEEPVWGDPEVAGHRCGSPASKK